MNKHINITSDFFKIFFIRHKPTKHNYIYISKLSIGIIRKTNLLNLLFKYPG